MLYKTSVGGGVPRWGTEKPWNKGGEARERWRVGIKGIARKKEAGKGEEEGRGKKPTEESEREGITHCKLNLKADQMGAVMVARAPLFHPSWHFSSGLTKRRKMIAPDRGLVFRLRNLAAITPLTHYPRPRARFRVISSDSDRTNASSWAPREEPNRATRSALRQVYLTLSVLPPWKFADFAYRPSWRNTRSAIWLATVSCRDF